MTDRKFTHPDDAGPDHPGYVTRDGRPARIICTNANGPHPIIALVTENGSEFPVKLTKGGRYIDALDGIDEDDIFDAPKPKKRGVYERWVNVYPFVTDSHFTRGGADKKAQSDRIACIHIRQEWEEGEGL